MLIALLVDALASDPPRLDLNLACDGQYQTVETSTGTTRGMVDGEYRTRTTQLETPVMRPGTAHFVFKDTEGQLTYPDGKVRALSGVAADNNKITATYQRKVLFVPITWNVEISRTTGMARVFAGRDVAFSGSCHAESTQPKF